MNRTLIAVALLAASLGLSAKAHAFGFENRWNRGVCVAYSGSSGVGWYCTSGYSMLNQSAHYAYGQIRFLNTSLCLNASSPTTVNVLPCNGSSRQRWTFSSNGWRIYSAIYGSSNVLAGSGLGSGLWLSTPSDPYFNHDSRRWIVRG